jgi:hypothetical protein
VNFSILEGVTLSDIKEIYGDLLFYTVDGDSFKLYYEQDCCASCSLEETIGHIQDLIGTPILLAEEVVGGEDPEGWKPGEYEESYTWSFYKLSTIKGSVTFRWYGSSNGYYSETCSFVGFIKCRVCKSEIETGERWGSDISIVKLADGTLVCSEACANLINVIPLCFE